MNAEPMMVKGSALASLPLFVQRKLGQERYKEWIAALSPEVAEIFSGSRLRVSRWYHVESYFLEPLEIMCRMFYDGRREGAYESGRFSAEYSLRGIYKSLVRLGSPRWAVKRGSQAIQLYYSQAELQVIEHTDKDVTVRITRFPVAHILLEERIRGWMQRAGEISGAIEVTVEHVKSLARGDDCTEFRVRWR